MPVSPFFHDSPAIEVKSLQKTYSDGFFMRRRVEALRGVTFQVCGVSIFGLFGSGTGAGEDHAH